MTGIRRLREHIAVGIGHQTEIIAILLHTFGIFGVATGVWQIATRFLVPVERIGLHLMHIHPHFVGAHHLAVLRGDLQFHGMGEVDAVGGFATVFHFLLIFHPFAFAHLKHRLAHSIGEGDRHGEMRHIRALGQGVGVVNQVFVLVDGEKHGVEIIEHLIVAAQSETRHQGRGVAIRNHKRGAGALVVGTTRSCGNH